jgi:PAS domain S-box-containing protein
MDNETRFIWNVAPIGMCRVGRDGRFIAVNPEFCEMVGYAETELLARTFQQITHPEDATPDSIEASNLAGNSGTQGYQMVKRYISKDGRIVWGNLHVHAIRNSDGGFVEFFSFVVELSPVRVSSDGKTNEGNPKNISGATLIDYVRTNPKEAALIIGAIAAITKGADSILDFFRKLMV